MRWTRQGYAAIAEVSRAVAEHAITEREACVELAARTGREPRALVMAVRVGVKLFEGRAGQVRHAAVGLEREIRRLRAAQRN